MKDRNQLVNLSFLTTLGLILLAVLSSPAYAASEKGPRCSDGIDNDGDGLVDGADSDCGGNSDLEARVAALEAIAADHEARLITLETLESTETESFDSEAAAAANGWVLSNGVGNWGWQASNSAGGDAGEARADSYTAGTQRWYADVQLENVLSFNTDWRAEGKMDFVADSASDGGMLFGFFDRTGSVGGDTQVVAGFLLVNGGLSLRFERRPDVPFLETADFGLWVNEDHTFVMAYDADGGPTGYGRLTGTVIRTSDGLTIAQQLDVPLVSVVGAELNSFGFYAMDVFPGRATVFDWVVDDLIYGTP